MKKLITANDIEKLIQRGHSSLIIDSKTIITPSARDIASANGIRFEEATNPSVSENETEMMALNSQYIAQLLSIMQEAGLRTKDLEKALADVIKKKKSRYHAVRSLDGLKLVKSQSVEMDHCQECPGITFQELIDKRESSVQAGFMNVGSQIFEKKRAQDMVYYIIQGPLDVDMDGHVIEAQSGDVLYVPGGQTFKGRSQFGQARLFYAEH